MHLVAKWQEALERSGECIDICYGRRPESSRALEWFRISHKSCDGLGGFWELLRKYGGFEGFIPTLRKGVRPGPLSTLQFVFSGKAPYRNLKYLWNFEPRAAVRKDPQTISLAPAQTERLQTVSRSGRISWNSLILFHLNSAIGEFLKDSECRSWMIPVNMRTEGDRLNPGYFASYIPCHLDRGDSPVQVHGKIASALRQGYHWHVWRSLILGAILGPTAMRQFIAHRPNSQTWVGSFSNLGEWKTDRRDSWFFAPPCSVSVPIGVGALILNGRLNIGVQVHSTWPPEVAEQIARNLEANLLKRPDSV